MSDIKFMPGNTAHNIKKGETILALAKRQNISLDHSCGGMGICGTCRVIVINGIDKLPTRNKIEQEIANDRGFEQKERLSCQNQAISGLVLEIP